MAKTDAAEANSSHPPYIPWKSLENYVAGLKKVGTVPHTLDSSTKPSSMAGGMWRSLVAALKFLKLIASDGQATDNFSQLVKSHGTPDWPAAVKKFVVPAYKVIITDLPLENATASQLDAKFRAHSKIDGQLLRKAERFYMHALHEAGIKYSSLFSMRRESSSNGKRRATAKKTGETGGKPANRESPPRTHDETGGRKETPAGVIDIPIPIDETSHIRVPRNITNEQMPVVQAALAMVMAMAERNAKVAK